jgi:hypothetical protein
MSKFKNSFINSLCTDAHKSIISQQLVSVVIHGTKMICKPCCNTPQNTSADHLVVVYTPRLEQLLISWTLIVIR